MLTHGGKLNDSGEYDRAASIHAKYFRDLLDRAEIEVADRSSDDWRNIHAGHLDNVRSALDWAFSPDGNLAVGIALTISTVSLWLNLSLMDECRKRVKHALSHLSSSGSATLRQEMQLLTALGVALFPSVQASNQMRYGSG